MASREGKKWQVPRYGGAETLELVSFTLPQELKPTEVLIRILATSATYTDLIVIQGYHPPPQPPAPCTPGYECVGVVEAVGSKVTSVKPGDRVASMPQHGCMATHAIIPSRLVFKIREDVDPSKAVSVVLTGTTAYQLLNWSSRGRLKPDAKILVHGCAGGTGAMIVELAKLAGVPPGNIYGTCSEKNFNVAKEQGIRFYSYKTDWASEILAASGGVDLVFDHVFLNSYFDKGLKCLKSSGRYIAYGLTSTDKPGTMHIPSVAVQQIRLALQRYFWACFGYAGAEFFAGRRYAHPDEFAAEVRTLIDLLADGRLSPHIGKVWTFEEAKEALVSIQENTHTGKQIITVASS